MTLKITPDIFKWLQSLSIVKQAKRNNDFLELSQDVSLKFFDGITIAIIIKSHFKHIADEQSIKKLQNLKQNSNPAIRLYNWNILMQVLKKCKIITLDSAQKSKIISMQSQVILKILRCLFQLKQKSLIPQSKGLKVQLSDIQKKSLLQTSNIMQFMILSLSKNFKLSAQHTLNLFIDNNKYLSHLIVKGVKNNYQPIYDFIMDLTTNTQYIVGNLFCMDQEDNVNFFYNALKSCIISKDNKTTQYCMELWLDVHRNHKIKGISTKLLKKWIKTEGINTLFFTITKNSQFFNQTIQLCWEYLQIQLFDFFQYSEKSMLWSNDKEKMKFFKRFLILENKEIVLKFLTSDFLNQWLKYFTKNIKRMKQAQQVIDMNIIFENLWLLMQQKFQDQSLNLVNTYLQFLKQNLSSPNLLIFLTSSTSLFNLLKVLGDKKNNYAPFLYKSILTTFNSLNSNDEQKILFLCENLNVSIKQIKSLPGGPLVQPLIKHLDNHVYSSLIILGKTLFEQKRLSEQQSVQILQILTKIIFHDSDYSQIAIQIVFQNILSINDQIADQYLSSNSKLSLSHFVSQAKFINKPFKQIKSQILQLQKKDNQDNKKKDALLLQLNKIILLERSLLFLNNYLDVNDINLKNSLESVLFHTYVKVKIQLKKKKVADLLLPLMRRYFMSDEQIQSQIKQYQRQAYPQAQPKQYSSKITLLKSIRINKSMDLSSIQTQSLVLPNFSLLKPSSFALKDLQSLKVRKQTLKTIQIQKQKQSQQSIEKQKQIKNFMNQKRLIQFGTGGKADVQYKAIYQYQTMKEQQLVGGVPLIRLVNFQNQDEITYQDDLKSLIKKYRKVWKFLFFKYSTFGAKKQQFKTQQKIHMAQVWKMLRQYQVFNLLKKQQSQLIIKLINDTMKRKSDPQCLTYSGFQQYISQVCAYSYSKSGYPHIPVGRQLLLFIQQLKTITKQKGGSVQIFQNPQDVYFQQTEVIREYNKRLKKNPDYILPQGYKKYKQVNLQYQYNVHPMLHRNIQTSYVDVYQLLQQIFYEKFMFNLIQPISLKSQITLAKPALFQNIAQKMKDYKKGYLQPKATIQIKDEKQKQIKSSITLRKQFHPMVNFSLGIKLGLSSVSVKNKTIAEEVAYWMHDMLKAVQNQTTKVQHTLMKKIQNSIIKKRRYQTLQKTKSQRQDKKQWRKRAQSVKVKLQLQKKKKQELLVTKKQAQLQEKRKKRVMQQQSLKRRLKRFSSMKKTLQQRKQQAKYLKQQQQSVRKQKLISYRQKVQQYFQKKKQQLLERQQQLKKKKQQQQQQKKQKKQKAQKFIKQLYLQNLKKEETILQKADQIKDKYNQLYQSQEIQKQFKKYQKQTIYLFNLLLKYQKGKISATKFDQIGLNTLHYFTLKFMLVPFLVQKTDLVKIFNYIIKQKQKKALQQSAITQTIQVSTSFSRAKSPGLKLKDFQQSLLLMCIKQKVQLNKLHEKRKSRIQKVKQHLKQNKQSTNQDLQQLSQDQSDQQSQTQKQKNPGLLDQYLFNVDDVDQNTLSMIFLLLKLPKDKFGVDARYRQAIQAKNVKPKKILINDLKKLLTQVRIQDIKQNQDSQDGSDDQS